MKKFRNLIFLILVVLCSCSRADVENNEVNLEPVPMLWDGGDYLPLFGLNKPNIAMAYALAAQHEVHLDRLFLPTKSIDLLRPFEDFFYEDSVLVGIKGTSKCIARFYILYDEEGVPFGVIPSSSIVYTIYDDPFEREALDPYMDDFFD